MSVLMDTVAFNNQFSIMGLANSAIGQAQAIGNNGWSVTNLTIAGRSISATDSTAANVAKSLATLVNELVHKGVIRGTPI